jgi:MarR-like DNA-binding transcriptional regulator SgrR of sgrS sRNA
MEADVAHGVALRAAQRACTFHDGTPFTADDVVFSFARCQVTART